MKLKQKAKIKNWEVVPSFGWKYGEYQLVGEIIEHPDKPKFQTGRQITSLLESIDFHKKTAETLNTIYELVNDDV